MSAATAQFKSITHSYDKVRQEGVKVVHEAARLDRSRQEAGSCSRAASACPTTGSWSRPASTSSSTRCPAIRRPAAEVMPHAWKPGQQTELLVRKLNALKDGDTIVMIAPPNPLSLPARARTSASRCSRTCSRQKGTQNRGSSCIDPKPTLLKQALFLEGWEKHYPGMIEWQDPKMHGGIKGVDRHTDEVKTDLANYKATLANVIPAQMAGKIARDAGARRPDRLLPDRPGEHEVEDGRQHLRRRRRLHSRRHAEIGVLGQQPGQGRRR